MTSEFLLATSSTPLDVLPFAVFPPAAEPWPSFELIPSRAILPPDLTVLPKPSVTPPTVFASPPPTAPTWQPVNNRPTSTQILGTIESCIQCSPRYPKRPSRRLRLLVRHRPPCLGRWPVCLLPAPAAPVADCSKPAVLVPSWPVCFSPAPAAPVADSSKPALLVQYYSIFSAHVH